MSDRIAAEVNGLRPVRSALGRRGVATAALVLAATCWGTALVMTKSALTALPPFVLFPLQLGSAVLFLWTCVALRGRAIPLDRVAITGALAGILEPGLAYAACVWGLTKTDASSASVILASEPLFIVLLAWWLFAERPAIRTGVLLGVGLAGVLLVSWPTGGGLGHTGGNLLIIIGTVCAALYVVLTSRSVQGIDSLSLVALQQSMGFALALVLLVGTVASNAYALPHGVPYHVLILGAVSGIVQYALAFWLYLLGLKHVPVTVAAMFLALIPVVGVCCAVIFLGESMDWRQWVGCVIVVLSVLLVVRR